MSAPRSAANPRRDDTSTNTEGPRIPIEELSLKTGVTVRNLRELQTRGLLDPPELKGRKGLYTQRHIARVTLVRSLQDRGYSLASIGDLLERWEGSLGPLGLMGIEDGVSTPGLPSARRLDEAELFALLPELRKNARLLSGAEATELVAKDSDGAFFAPHAEFIETARELADAGIPLDVQFADYVVLRREIDAMATRFRARFQEHVVARLQQDDGMGAKGIEELAARVARLRPAVVRSVALALSTAIDRGGPLEVQGPVKKPKAKARKASAKKRG